MINSGKVLIIKTFRINLSTDSYKIGRTTGDYVVQLSDMGDERLYNSVSSTQCEIVKTDVGVFLKDFSTNGKDWRLKPDGSLTMERSKLNEKIPGGFFLFFSWEDLGPLRLTYLEFCVCVNTKLK